MTRTVSLGLLDHVRLASPCPMKWEHMAAAGDDARIRHCGHCNLSVHNISGMTRDEAEAFLASAVPGERVCGMFWRRPDGTILTRDCPVGLRAARQRLVTWVTRAAAGLVLLLVGAAFARSRDPGSRGPTGLASLRPFSTLSYWARGAAALPPQQLRYLGGLIIPVVSGGAPPAGTPASGGR